VATVEFSTLIRRPAEEVFDLLADVSRNPEWCPGFAGAEKVTTGPIGRETAFRTAMAGMGTMEIRITDYERPRRLWFVAATASAEIGHGFTFTVEPSGTRVAQRIVVCPSGLLRFAAPLMALMLKRRIQANTAALKEYMERGPSGTRVTSRGTEAEEASRAVT
jgi:uncharacterized protein YndB with AHSA1/START domain